MEEISLREYIEVLLKWKKTIALITIISMLLGLLVGFVQPKVYKATAILLTNPINATEKKETDTTSLSGLINSMSQYPQMDIDTYKEQFLSSDVVSKTIHDLNLVNKDGSYISMNEFRKKITVENPDKTNLLTITVEDENPELAANITNSLCNYFSQFVSELNRSQGLASSKAILAQIELEKENLDLESKKLRDYLAGSESIEALNSEIKEIITQLSSYKTDLNDVQVAIITDKAALEVLLNGNKSTLGLATGDIKVNVPSTADNTKDKDKDKNTDKDKPTTSFQISLDSSNKLQGSLLTMEITNTETRLNANIAKQASLTAKINEVEADLTKLQATLAEEQYKYNAIRRDYDLAEQTYNAYQEKYKQALITSASDIGRVSIQISSSAVAPEDPSNISKIIILAISAMLGFLIAVFVVFFREYWSTTTSINTKK